jgi:hypothetical protein
MNNLTIQFKELPETMLGFFTRINESEYIVLNDKNNKQYQALAYLGCMYYYKQGSYVGKITIADIERENFEPITYARNKIQMMLGA